LYFREIVLGHVKSTRLVAILNVAYATLGELPAIVQCKRPAASRGSESRTPAVHQLKSLIFGSLSAMGTVHVKAALGKFRFLGPERIVTVCSNSGRYYAVSEGFATVAAIQNPFGHVSAAPQIGWQNVNRFGPSLLYQRYGTTKGVMRPPRLDSKKL
jgi:hypothetical protein